MLHNSQVADGTFIDDSQATNNVVVLGANLATKLFPDGGAVGQKVRISGQSFDVIGVMATKGTGASGFDDEAAFVPLTVAQRKLFVSRVAGAGNKTSVSSIVVQAKDSQQRRRAANPDRAGVADQPQSADLRRQR